MRFNRHQLEGSKIAEQLKDQGIFQDSLFGDKQLSRNEKLKKSRKQTTDLTKSIIDHLNLTGLFEVHRQNNIPSTILKREKVTVKAIDNSGKPYDHTYEKVHTMFKKGTIKKKLLDIAGFATQYNDAVNGGTHIEIEIKTGKDKLDDEQLQRINDIKKAGGIAFAVTNWDDYIFQISPFLKKKPAF